MTITSSVSCSALDLYLCPPLPLAAPLRKLEAPKKDMIDSHFEDEKGDVREGGEGGKRRKRRRSIKNFVISSFDLFSDMNLPAKFKDFFFQSEFCVHFVFLNSDDLRMT
jgi:hypothetical protein